MKWINDINKANFAKLMNKNPTIFVCLNCVFVTKDIILGVYKCLLLKYIEITHVII